MTEDKKNEPALVHVVRGEPDDVELAALVAGLAAATAGVQDVYVPQTSEWSDPSRTLSTRAGTRPPATPGPNTWRWSLHG